MMLPLSCKSCGGVVERTGVCRECGHDHAKKRAVTYTHEQLEAMDDTDLGLQVGKFCDDFANDPDVWLAGDGMLALMEWCNAHDMEVTLYNSTFSTHFVGWAATIEKQGRHADMVDVAWVASAPRALAIAVVLAVQGQEPDRVV